MSDTILTGNKETVDAPISPPHENGKVVGGAPIPDKFTSVDDLAAAYKELEKKLGEKSGETSPTPELKLEVPKPEDPKTGSDFDIFTEEYAKNGSLSPESYAALEAKGIPKTLVDHFIAGQEARTQVNETKFFEMVGGKDEYAKMVDWAGKNLNAAEIQAFNEAAASGKADTIAFAVQGLKARFSNNTKPTRNVMGQPTSGGLRPFSSQAAMVLAMQDPRYERDPDYQHEVMERARISQI